MPTQGIFTEADATVCRALGRKNVIRPVLNNMPWLGTVTPGHAATTTLMLPVATGDAA